MLSAKIHMLLFHLSSFHGSMCKVFNGLAVVVPSLMHANAIVCEDLKCMHYWLILYCCIVTLLQYCMMHISFCINFFLLVCIILDNVFIR